MGSARAIRPVLVAVLVVLVATGCGSYETGASRASRPVATPPSSSTVPARQLDGVPDTVMFGFIKSLTRKRGRFEMRFDPMLWLGGVTAYRAAVEDKSIKPGESVSNDYYVRDEGHRLLTYLVPASARITVVTRGIISTRIPVSELAQLLQGKNPQRRRLEDEPPMKHLGWWIRADNDTVRWLEQQWRP